MSGHDRQDKRDGYAERNDELTYADGADDVPGSPAKSEQTCRDDWTPASTTRCVQEASSRPERRNDCRSDWLAGDLPERSQHKPCADKSEIGGYDRLHR